MSKLETELITLLRKLKADLGCDELLKQVKIISDEVLNQMEESKKDSFDLSMKNLIIHLDTNGITESD